MHYEGLESNSVDKMKVVFEGSDEIQSLGVACSELASTQRRNIEEQPYFLLGVRAMRAATEGVEPRQLSLAGTEAAVALRAIRLWARDLGVSESTHSKPYVRSWKQAKTLELQLAAS